MKEEIEYLYNLRINELKKYDNNIIFLSDNNYYKVERSLRSEEELDIIYDITFSSLEFNKLIKTRFNKVVFNYENNNYIVYKIIHNNDIGDFIRSLNYRKNYNILKRNILFHDNSYFLISKKVDYIEYQYEHIKGKYPIIDESIDYFIGLAECSINYLKRAQNSPYKDDLVLSHKRINEFLYSPNELIIDSSVRDVAGILKYIFWNDIKNIDIRNFILNLNFNKLQYEKLIFRMLYPSFYFDSYEKLINNNKKEEKSNIKKFIESSSSYEKYVLNIINIISLKENVMKVQFL